MITAIRNTDIIYVVVSDSGGGSDGNPFRSLADAVANIGDETGIEIWEMTFEDYLRVEDPDADAPPDFDDVGHKVFERW